MGNDARDWPLRVFKLVALAAVVVMLTQPETWALALYFLDASMLEVLAVLLQVQIAVMSAPLMRRVVRPGWLPVRKWLAVRRSPGCLRTAGAAARTFTAAWRGRIGAALWLWMHERSREFCRGY